MDLCRKQFLVSVLPAAMQTFGDSEWAKCDGKSATLRSYAAIVCDLWGLKALDRKGREDMPKVSKFCKPHQ